MPLLYCQAVKVGLNIMRNKSLDAGKAMAAFGVVFIHVSFPGQTGQIIKALARSAVPFFFMVSGYFCYYIEETPTEENVSQIKYRRKCSIS